MELLPTIARVHVIALVLLAGTGLPALAQCPTDQYKVVYTFHKSCAGERALECGDKHPKLKPGDNLCCPLSADHETPWYCDGEEDQLHCPTTSVRIGVEAVAKGLALTCYASTPPPPPPTSPDIVPTPPQDPDQTQ